MSMVQADGTCTTAGSHGIRGNDGTPAFQGSRLSQRAPIFRARRLHRTNSSPGSSSHRPENKTSSQIKTCGSVLFQMTYVLLFQISRRRVSDVVELIGRVVSDAIVAAISGDMALVSYVK